MKNIKLLLNEMLDDGTFYIAIISLLITILIIYKCNHAQ